MTDKRASAPCPLDGCYLEGPHDHGAFSSVPTRPSAPCEGCASLRNQLAKAQAQVEWARLEASQADAELERLRDRYERKVA